MLVDFVDNESSMVVYTLEKDDVNFLERLLVDIQRHKDGSLTWEDLERSLRSPMSIRLIPLIYEERYGSNLNTYQVRLQANASYETLAASLTPIYEYYAKMIKNLLVEIRGGNHICLPAYLQRELHKYIINRFGKLEYARSNVWMLSPYNVPHYSPSFNTKPNMQFLKRLEETAKMNAQHDAVKIDNPSDNPVIYQEEESAHGTQGHSQVND